jgi:hypothetical protein
MTVHVGELSTEVVATGEPAGPDRAEVSVWEREQQLRSTVDWIACVRARTATGHDDD